MKKINFYCNDCAKKHDLEPEKVRAYEQCSSCGKQSMCSDATDLNIEIEEEIEEIKPFEKVTFAKIVETPTHQVLLTKMFDAETNNYFLKAESDFSDVGAEIGASRFALQLGVPDGESIDALFDEFDLPAATDLIKDLEQRIKEQVETAKLMQQENPLKS